MKILVADDHWLILEAVQTKLAELEERVEFVIAMNAEELEEASLDGVDVAMIDLSIPGASDYSHIDALRERSPTLPIIVFSGSEDPGIMRSVLQRGVLGFIPKAYSPSVMLSAVRLVLAGGVYVPPMMLPVLAADASVDVPADRELFRVAAPGPDRSQPPTMETLRQVLTARQVEVLQLLSQGKPNKLIGRSLGISEGTVKIHLAAIFRALNVRNRTEAVVAARTLTEA
ncbi:LuxR C-terminal-related transcriptional regulator [Diaphorobacter aerolatus]|uniref:Response regulator transcription factor n=1 Tax=Diaphorobacter aerolatus TaxID=1288495 RepID=A0A7H0GLI5_9BURK|nr:response regulator transcription factor [Diaphorobacter aerolatus]QNP49151.1 response regulator transcription factor [Diaphorobacter aerolatus]